MRKPLNQDDVEDVVLSARSPAEHRAAAAQLGAWAEETHPEDEEVTPAWLLVSAGEELALAEDHEGALQLFERAVVAEGEAVPDVRCYLHNGLLRAGQADRTRALAEEVRRSRPADPDVYLFIGEGYELVGDLPEANRWFTLGLMRVVREVGEEGLTDFRMVFLLNARRRVRQTLGFPPDEYDALAAVSMSEE